MNQIGLFVFHVERALTKINIQEQDLPQSSK